MKETIKDLENIAKTLDAHAKANRSIGDHIHATQQERHAKNLRILLKLARLIWP